jgi:hypothetical protein
MKKSCIQKGAESLIVVPHIHHVATRGLHRFSEEACATLTPVCRICEDENIWRVISVNDGLEATTSFNIT